MKESDWKVFKDIKKLAIDKHCTRALDDFSEIIDNDQEDSHDRYLKLYELVHERDKDMSIMFDGHSRSKALIQLLLIRRNGLADEKLLQKLSDEFFRATNPEQLD